MEILLIDDDPNDLADLVNQVSERGDDLSNVQTAPSLEKAVAVLETQAFDLVVSDFGLGDGTALDLLARYHSVEGFPPVIIITGSDTEDVSTVASLAGAAGVISKRGLTPQVLKMAIKVAHDNEAARQQAAQRAAELEAQAHTDPLTGIANRRRYEKICETLISDQDGSPFGLLLIDLDDFKITNDQLGHSQGDTVLKRTAMALETALPTGAHLCRIGGDEFCAILPNLAKKQDVTKFANKIRDLPLFPARNSGVEVEITVTTGAAHFPTDGLDLMSLRHACDRGLKTAKRGKPKQVIKRIDQPRDDKAGLTLWLQPVFNLVDNSILQFEALARMRDAHGNILLPQAFLDKIAAPGEKMNFAKQGLQIASEHHRKISASLGRSIPIFVNMDADVLMMDGFSEIYTKILAKNGLKPGDISIELTERVEIQDLSIMNQKLNELHAAGCQIALDYFCVGHSTFEWLTQLPADIIKIDQSIVERLPHCRRSQILFHHLVAMMQNLGGRAIADECETDQQVFAARDFGCDGAQGYALARPMPLKDVIAQYGRITHRPPEPEAA